MNPEYLDTVIDKKAIKRLTDLQAELDKTDKLFLEVAENASKIGANLNNIKYPRDLEKQLKKTIEYHQKSVESAEKTRLAEIKLQQAREKAFDRYEKQLQKEQREKEKAFSKEVSISKRKSRQDALQIENQKVLSQNARRQAVLASNMVGEYKKQSTQLNILRDRYKDLILTTKEETDETRKLKNEINKLDSELKEVDASVGQHQRSVGNYTLATEGLHPALDMVNQGLMSMGTSLDDLSNSKDPFSDLATSVKDFGKATLAFLLSPVGLAITALGALFLLIRGNKDTIIAFDSDLRDVGKTTGIAGEELEGLGNDIIGLSKKLETVGTPALLGYAKVAGQLGVKGRRNILKFTEGLAMLEVASDISGEQGASQIARLLTLTDGGVQKIEAFGDEIVKLGNNFAATESEILGNATAIAQNTGQYEFGRRSTLAYATATKAVGIEAEITGSTIGRSLGLMEKAIRTGQGLDKIARITGQSVEELRSNFKDNAAGVFNDFVTGLNAVDKSGGSVNAQLESIGITAVRDQRVIASLATGGFETLKGAIDSVTDSSGAMGKEFDDASKKLGAQLSRVGKAWDNLMLSLENGQGPIGETFAYFSGKIADVIDGLTELNRTFTEAMDQGKSKGEETILDDLKKDVEEFGGSIEDAAKYRLPGLLDQLEGYRKKLGELQKEQQSSSRWFTAWATTDGLTLNHRIKKTGELIGKYEEMARIAKEVAAGQGEWFDFTQHPGTEQDQENNTKPKEPKYNQGSIAAIQASISALEEQRDKFATTSEEIRQYNNAINKLQNELDNLSPKAKSTDLWFDSSGVMDVEDPEISAPTDTFELEAKIFEDKEIRKTEFLKQEEEKRRQAVADTFSQFADFYGIDFDAFENLITKKKSTREDYVDAAASAANTILNMTRQRYDDELRMAQENRDAVVNNEKATEEQKRLAEKEYREKEKQIKRKQAEDEKRAAIFKIAINTAVAIVKAFPNIANMALAAALGAAQTAFVSAQPVPKFKDGHLLGTYEGPAIINDAPGNNYREIIERKDGALESPMKRNVLIGMNKGDKVHKSHDAFLKTRNYDDIVQASILTSILNQQEKMTSAELGNAFDYNLINETIKKGFRDIKINNHNHNHVNNDKLAKELELRRKINI